MSGLHEAFDEIVADVPVYGDLDRAIEQADLDSRRLRTVVAGLVAASAAAAVIVVALAVARGGNDIKEPVGPVGPTPTTSQSQSPQTWVDTRVAPHAGYGWVVPDPLATARDAWYAIAADHLDPVGVQLDPQGDDGSAFTWRVDGWFYPVSGLLGLVADGGALTPLDGCRFLLGGPAPSNGTESCEDERVTGPHDEPARIAHYQRLCDSWDPGSPGDDARPGAGTTYETCGEFRVAVAVERQDGLIGYLVVDGRGTSDDDPFSPDDLVAAAADPRLTLPEAAFEVPPGDTVAAVVSDHFPGWRADPETTAVQEQPGSAAVWGKLGPNGLSVTLRPAAGDPVCGRAWLVRCVERRVYGADDATTVFVGAWDEEAWADCCPRNSRAFSRQFVYVGPQHTVVVRLSRIVREHEDGIGPELDQRVIDLLLDPRLQEGGEHR